MKNFAVVEDNKVTNVIVADSKEIAEEVTGGEVIETEGQPWLDWVRVDDVWQAPVIQELTVEEPIAE
jgi:hypothetical protein